MNEVNDPATKSAVEIDVDSFDNREKLFALALWTMPIWWSYSYGGLLWAGNQITSSLGSPLYLIVPTGLLKVLLAAGFLAALVFCCRIPKWSKQHTIYTFVIWWFIACFSGITDGGMTAALEVAAGRPMSSFGHPSKTQPAVIK
ncbi:MAG: hypothetical protein JSS83_23305 [Cyanobacteria bacterium SZAS LIN-3]|nr:hypothetical protein [Cyanobacteria bacterium SZAS LIN-3]